MPAVIAKRKWVEVVDRINPELEKEIPNQLVIERARQDGNKLVENFMTRAEGHHVLGMVATLQTQPDKVVEHFEKAMAAEANRAIECNALLSYGRLGLFAKAVELAERFLTIYRDDIERLKQAMDTLADTCQFGMAIAAVDALRKLGKDIPCDWLEDNYGDFVNALDRASANERDLVPVMELAASVPIEHGKPIRGILFSIAQEGRLAVSFAIDGDVDELVDINLAIADRLAGSKVNTFASVITLSCAAYPRHS